MAASVRFSNGVETRIVNRWVIPYSFWPDYLEGSCEIDEAGTKVEVPFTDFCQLCDREYVRCSRRYPVICQYSPINRQVGYPAKICRDCYYWIELQLGNEAIPRSVRKALDEGHKPTKFDYLFQ